MIKTDAMITAFLPAFLSLALPVSAALDEWKSQAREFSRSGDLRSALRADEKLAASPESDDAGRAEALRDGAKLRALLGDAAGAERDYSLALKLDPADGAAALGLARALRDRPEQALAAARRAAAVPSGPRRAAALRLAGEIRMDLGDADGARAELDKALAEDAADLDALQDLARLLRARPAEASAYARRACGVAERTPVWARPDALLQCARVWLEIPDRAGAESALREAAALDPDHLDVWETLVSIKREAEKEGGADSAAREAGADAGHPSGDVDPEGLESLRRRTAALKRGKRLAEARALADRFMDAVDDAPAWEQAAAYSLLTRVWLELGDRPWALRSYLKARDLDPRSFPIAVMGVELDVSGPTPLDALGSIVRARAELSGVGEGQLQDFAAPLEYGRDDASALLAAAESNLVEGRGNEALAYARRLVQVSPALSPQARSAAYRLRGVIRRQLLDEAGARADLRRAAASAPAL